MTHPAENDAAHLMHVIASHHLEVETRTYPSYACSCEQWDGALGDNGGEKDGINDNEHGHAAHVAERLLALGYRRVIPPAKGGAE